jgi:hypothetical protein
MRQSGKKDFAPPETPPNVRTRINQNLKVCKKNDVILEEEEDTSISYTNTSVVSSFLPSHVSTTRTEV